MLKMLMKRFIAGNTPEQALRVAKNLMDEGFLVDLNIIGENETPITSLAFEYYKNLIAWMRKENVFTDISLKFSHFGNIIAPAEISYLAKELESAGKRITLDMEDIETDFNIYCALEYFIKENINYVGITNVGIALALNRRNITVPYSSNLKCGKFAITSCGHNFVIPYSKVYRICKGTNYKENKNFQNGLEPTNTMTIRYRFFYTTLLKGGIYTGLATVRDSKLIQEIIGFVERFKIPKNSFEFQMLYGIRMDIARQLLKQGYRVRIYVPFLFNEPYKKALPYFLRRCSFKVIAALIQEKINPVH